MDETWDALVTLSVGNFCHGRSPVLVAAPIPLSALCSYVPNLIKVVPLFPSRAERKSQNMGINKNVNCML